MRILSHRGFWTHPEEKNTVEAFRRSFDLGFGVETDIRDFDGELVISHDPANGACLRLNEFFQIYLSFASRPMLALNIKADGLQPLLDQCISRHQIESYFVFDMSIPDSLAYLRAGFSVYTRQSEYETEPAYYSQAAGVWLDQFHGSWFDDSVIEKHVAAGKPVCLVSPELHKRPHEAAWRNYRALERRIGKDCLMLCTDFPEQAHEFFNA